MVVSGPQTRRNQPTHLRSTTKSGPALRSFSMLHSAVDLFYAWRYALLCYTLRYLLYTRHGTGSYHTITYHHIKPYPYLPDPYHTHLPSQSQSRTVPYRTNTDTTRLRCCTALLPCPPMPKYTSPLHHATKYLSSICARPCIHKSMGHGSRSPMQEQCEPCLSWSR